MLTQLRLIISSTDKWLNIRQSTSWLKYHDFDDTNNASCDVVFCRFIGGTSLSTVVVPLVIITVGWWCLFCNENVCVFSLAERLRYQEQAGNQLNELSLSCKSVGILIVESTKSIHFVVVSETCRLLLWFTVDRKSGGLKRNNWVLTVGNSRKIHALDAGVSHLTYEPGKWLLKR